MNFTPISTAIDREFLVGSVNDIKDIIYVLKYILRVPHNQMVIGHHCLIKVSNIISNEIMYLVRVV